MGYAEGNVEGQAFVAAFREELLKLGWAEGRNLRSDYRWAPPGDVEATRRFAKELIALQPNLILAHNTAATAAAQEQTHTIPILFAIVADPVGSGFVTSLSRRHRFHHAGADDGRQVARVAQGDCAARQQGRVHVQSEPAPYAELFVKALQGCSRVPGHVTARIVEEGPIPAIHGVVRWRACDLIMRLHEEFELSVGRYDLSRPQELGLLACERPAQGIQAECRGHGRVQKNFAERVAEIHAKLAPGTPLEVWFQDEMRVGQKNKLTYRWARKGSRPQAERLGGTAVEPRYESHPIPQWSSS
jgi:hypothetical protein